jgi:hypothetical protein
MSPSTFLNWPGSPKRGDSTESLLSLSFWEQPKEMVKTNVKKVKNAFDI